MLKCPQCENNKIQFVEHYNYVIYKCKKCEYKFRQEKGCNSRWER